MADAVGKENCTETAKFVVDNWIRVKEGQRERERDCFPWLRQTSFSSVCSSAQQYNSPISAIISIPIWLVQL